MTTVTAPGAARACPGVSDKKRKHRAESSDSSSLPATSRKRQAPQSAQSAQNVENAVQYSAADMCTDESVSGDNMDRASDSSEMEDNCASGAVLSTQLLQDACANGNNPMVDELLLTGTPADAITSEGFTLLHLVAKGTGSVACCASLLRAEPELLTARCRTGWTAALYAAQAGNWDMVSVLDTWV